MRKIFQNMVARCFVASGFASLKSFNYFTQNQIVAVNYHWTGPDCEKTFDQHMKWYSETFNFVNEDQLLLLNQGRVSYDRPPFVLSFDDGYLNNIEVALPIIERYCAIAWFFVISAGCAEDKQILGGNINSRFLMKWDDLSYLSTRKHVIGCHTHTHANLGRLDDHQIDEEVVKSANMIAENIGSPVSSFAFPFGTAGSYSRAALMALLPRFNFVFHNFPGRNFECSSLHSIGRIPMDARWPLDVVRLRLSGILARRYARSRLAYERMLQAVENVGSKNVSV